MTNQEFEECAQDVFESLPAVFRTTIDNVRIVVEELPGKSEKGWRSQGLLLGLYHGIPLNRRGVDYGVYPVLPDTITLYKQNIERVTHSDEELRACIRDVLIHEIGHYYGMSEEEIRRAGY